MMERREPVSKKCSELVQCEITSFLSFIWSLYFRWKYTQSRGRVIQKSVRKLHDGCTSGLENYRCIQREGVWSHRVPVYWLAWPREQISQSPGVYQCMYKTDTNILLSNGIFLPVMCNLLCIKFMDWFPYSSWQTTSLVLELIQWQSKIRKKKIHTFTLLNTSHGMIIWHTGWVTFWKYGFRLSYLHYVTKSVYLYIYWCKARPVSFGM